MIADSAPATFPAYAVEVDGLLSARWSREEAAAQHRVMPSQTTHRVKNNSQVPLHRCVASFSSAIAEKRALDGEVPLSAIWRRDNTLGQNLCVSTHHFCLQPLLFFRASTSPCRSSACTTDWPRVLTPLLLCLMRYSKVNLLNRKMLTNRLVLTRF